MNCILLSGGSGQRLWPLSNGIRSKQFIKVFENNNKQKESMLQRIYRQIHDVEPDAEIVIATSKAQASVIKNQVGKVNISIEPDRKDTFPAIALASAYMVEKCNISPQETVVVCPVDPYVEKDYFEALAVLGNIADKGDSNLVLMGMEPTEPSSKFGYIIPASMDKVSWVNKFKEKPEYEDAQSYINQGALWNGGVFAFKLQYILDIADKVLGMSTYQELFDNYSLLEKISFDYAVVEKEKKIQVYRFDGVWKDLGTWNSLVTSIPEKHSGNVLSDKVSNNSYVINELDIPIVTMGLDNLIVAATPDGILVSNKEDSPNIKCLVEQIDQIDMYSEKSWGSYTVIDVDDESLIMKVNLNKGNKMNYHSHKDRDEIWTVISGKGYVIQDGVTKEVIPGDVIEIKRGSKHTIIADEDIHLIEAQIGKDIDVNDKIKYPFPE